MEPSPPFSGTAVFAGLASWWFSECATCLTVGVHATSLQMWMEFAFWMQAGLRHDPIPQLEQYCPAIGKWFYNKTTTHILWPLSITMPKFSRRLKMIPFVVRRRLWQTLQWMGWMIKSEKCQWCRVSPFPTFFIPRLRLFSADELGSNQLLKYLKGKWVIGSFHQVHLSFSLYTVQ